MYEIEKVWKDWRIVRLLGEGSFGKVYEIERNNFGIEEHCALKVITVPQSSAELRTLRNEGMDEKSVTSYYKGMVRNFTQEIALMIKLKGSPGIVAYDDYAIVEHEGELGWDILIRMELLTPLADDMRSREYTRDDILKLGVELSKALTVCHENNIIHRDIKIDNIFVSENGHYKLGDFGVARNLEKTAGGLSKKGTYTYMAPEVYKGEPYGTRADIYSLGMVMYRLLNFNREPFLPPYPEVITFEDKDSALVRRMKGETFIGPINADESLSCAVLKACRYLPEERFSSAAEMRKELEQIFRGDNHAEAAYSKKQKEITIGEDAVIDSADDGAEATDEYEKTLSCLPDSVPEETGIAESEKKKGTEISEDAVIDSADDGAEATDEYEKTLSCLPDLASEDAYTSEDTVSQAEAYERMISSVAIRKYASYIIFYLILVAIIVITIVFAVSSNANATGTSTPDSNCINSYRNGLWRLFM